MGITPESPQPVPEIDEVLEKTLANYLVDTDDDWYHKERHRAVEYLRAMGFDEPTLKYVNACMIVEDIVSYIPSSRTTQMPEFFRAVRTSMAQARQEASVQGYDITDELKVLSITIDGIKYRHEERFQELNPELIDEELKTIDMLNRVASALKINFP